MPGLGFCCCCNDIYQGASSSFARNRIAGTPPDSSVTKTPSIIANYLDFDPVHKLVFAGPASELRRYTPQLTDPQTVIAAPTLQLITGVACDVDNEQLYYTLTDSPTDLDRYLRRVDYDGSGDVSIRNDTIPSATLSYRVRVARGASKLIIGTAISAVPQTGIIQTCNLDGSSLATIHTTVIPGLIRDLEWDNVHDKVLWIEEDPSAPIQMWIKRCNLDGSSVETLHTGPVSPATKYIHNALQFSAKHDKVYWFQYDPAHTAGDSDLDEGIFSMPPGGGTPELVINRFDFQGQGSGRIVVDMRLGCGFETTGAASLG